MSETGAATMAPRPPTPFEDEYAEGVFYIPDHLSDQQALLAVVIWLLDMDGNYSANDVYELLGDATVTRCYYRPDPDNDDRHLLCEATDDGAHPWTRVDGAS